MTTTLKEPVFRIGDRVKLKCAFRDFPHWSLDEVCEVVGYSAPVKTQYYTWPAYVDVKRGNGKLVGNLHASRFVLIGGLDA